MVVVGTAGICFKAQSLYTYHFDGKRDDGRIRTLNRAGLARDGGEWADQLYLASTLQMLVIVARSVLRTAGGAQTQASAQGRSSLYHGHALWVPDPAGLYDRVQVGDVGYVKQGQFLRMFNALLPADDSTQVYGVPEGYVPLNMGPFNNIRTLNLSHPVDYCSNTVTVDRGARHQAAGPDEAASASFRCRGNRAAFLTLPFNVDSVDAIRTKPFETYIHKHCDSWLEFAIINNLDVRLEDIILVTGCDLTSSWAMAAFVNSWDSEIKLSVASQSGSARFQWDLTNQPHDNESTQNVAKSHCVFIRGFRAKRILGFKTLKAAAESRPDDTDNELESSIELLREPTILDVVS